MMAESVIKSNEIIFKDLTYTISSGVAGKAEYIGELAVPDGYTTMSAVLIDGSINSILLGSVSETLVNAQLLAFARVYCVSSISNLSVTVRFYFKKI